MRRRTLRTALLATLAALVAAGEVAAESPALRVLVVRHAQAWKNVPKAQRPAGMGREQLDALTPTGVETAERIGRKLAARGVTEVWTSPARRAQQTAEAIARALGTGAPRVRPELRTLDDGTDGVDSLWRTRHWSAGEDPRPPGGESLADGLARAADALRAQASEHPGSILAVVTHGEITAALLSQASGIAPPAGYERNFVGEGTVSEIEVAADGTWALVSKGVRP